MSLDQTVAPGDPFSVDAADWNDVLYAARRAKILSSTPSEGPGLNYPCTIAKVKNDSGVALARFDAVGLGAPIISPTQNLAEFKRQPTFSVVKPVAGTHENKFGILLEPLASGAIGAAVVAGVVPAQITGTDVGFAEITNGQTYLTEGAGGSARVLWCESASGTRWALVRLGAAGVTGVNGTFVICESTGSPKSYLFENGILKSRT